MRVQPLVSIIIPVYNAEKYIARCLDSILSQTYTDFEVLVIDDGSTDTSGKTCDIYSKKDHRIYVEHQPNMGQSVAQNKALMKARGKYIVFIDADDYVADTLLEKTIPPMEQEDIDIVLFRHCEITNQGIVPYVNEFEKKNLTINDLPIQKIRELILLDEIPNMTWTKVYKKSVWENIQFPIGYRYEDLYICPELFLHVKTVKYIPELLYYNNRVNPQSMTSTTNDENPFNRYSKFKAYRHHEKIANQLGEMYAEKWAREKAIHEGIKIICKNFSNNKKITAEEFDDVINYLTENKQYDSDLGYKDKLLWWSALKHISICKVYGYISYKFRMRK